ncbi:MAG: glycosyltransferase family 39 protein [Lachnospiraceae bacterium]|nr:glycosyltransferase family 39 protein [Lachnospiraceae bacterium]
MKKKYANILLFMILILTLANSLYWGNRKEGYHVDEMYMYGTANSEYLPFMHMGPQEYSVREWMHEYGAASDPVSFLKNIRKDIGILKACNWNIKASPIYTAYQHARECSNDTYTSGWMNGSDYRDYLTASEDSRFNYFSVYYNFRGDNHPPLYAVLLHTVCSFFPGRFSKWFGIGLNSAIVSLTVLLLYTVVNRHLGGPVPALMISCLYGLSTAAALGTVFIRMYGLLTLSVLGFIYAHLRMTDKNFKWNKKDRRILVLFTLLGYLTQYYFLIFAFFTAITFSLILIRNKRASFLFRYIRTLIITGITGLILWPFTLKAIFSGTRSAESFGSIFNLSDLTVRIKTMLGVLSDSTVGLPYPLFLLLLLFLPLAACMTAKFKKDLRLIAVSEKGFILIVPFTFYFLIVSKIIPYLVDRYIMCLFPLCFILLFCPFAYLTKQLVSKKAGCSLVLTAGFVLFLITSSAFRHYNPYLFEGGQETDPVAAGTDCIYILPANWWNQSAEDTLLLSQCERSAVVAEDKLDCLNKSYAPDPGDKLMIVIREGLDTDADLAYLKDNLIKPGSNLSFKEKSRDISRGRTVITFDLSEAL